MNLGARPLVEDDSTWRWTYHGRPSDHHGPFKVYALAAVRRLYASKYFAFFEHLMDVSDADKCPAGWYRYPRMMLELSEDMVDRIRHGTMQELVVDVEIMGIVLKIKIDPKALKTEEHLQLKSDILPSEKIGKVRRTDVKRNALPRPWTSSIRAALESDLLDAFASSTVMFWSFINSTDGAPNPSRIIISGLFRRNLPGLSKVFAISISSESGASNFIMDGRRQSTRPWAS
jgi:hypothetical protein